MHNFGFPVIDPVATGKNIIRLRMERGLSVRDLQSYFGFEEPQAIYKWQSGKSLPTVDNLYALGALLNVPMEEILVRAVATEQQDSSCCSHFLPFVNHYSIFSEKVIQLLVEKRRSVKTLRRVTLYP